jgi:hypothetical protein
MAVNGAELAQLRRVEETPQSQNGVQGGGAVALGQDKPVPVRLCRIGGIHAHHGKVQGRENVHGGKGTAQMAGFGAVHHVQPQTPCPGGKTGQIVFVVFHESTPCHQKLTRWAM